MDLYDNARMVIAASSALTSIGVNHSLADLNCVVAELKAKGFTIPVRCKDCKHRGSDLCPMETVELYPWFGTKNDAFCSYGERREGE